MQPECELLIGALARSVTGKNFTMPQQVDWEKFVRFCKAHRVEALAYDGLRKQGVLEEAPEQIHKFLLGAYHTSIFRDSQFDYTRQRLAQKLEDAQVAHIFLKGSVLKYSYPEPALRTMCDIDILVHTEDYPTLDEISRDLEGKTGHGDGNHRNFAFPGGVAVEFHPNLLHHGTPVGTGINPGWQYAKESETAEKELTPEGFYLNTICHLANHFVSGGVGVRFVLDVWVNRHLHKPEANREIVEQELTKFGLLDFAKNIEDLAELWFGEGEETPLLQELGEYILTSGSHGVTSRAILNAVTLSPGQSQSSTLLKKAFYSREELEDRFPWCKGKPLLLPAAWCARAFRAVTKHGHLILQWGKQTGDVSKEQIQEQANLLDRFGIHRDK